MKKTTKSPIEKRQAGAAADSELKPKLTTSSPACTKPHVVRRFICVFLGHKAKNKFCQRCGQEFGIPKYNAPPPPPKRVIT